MKRRTVLAGVGSVGSAAIAGCSGILGGGGGGCSVPSDEDLEDMLPESGGGFEQGQTMNFGGGSSTTEGLENAAIATYTRDGGQYLAGVAEFEDEEAAQSGTDEASSGTDTAQLVYVQTGEYIFYTGAESGVGDESTLRDLLKRSALSDGCVDANAEFVEG